jgi:hypothetical protein
MNLSEKGFLQKSILEHENKFRLPNQRRLRYEVEN